MKVLPTLFLAGVLFLLGIGDIFAQSASATNASVDTNGVPSRAHWRTIKVKPDEDAPKVHFYNKLNPIWWFKNDDDPKPPDWYRPGQEHRQLKWAFRNPMHNFNFYVIGVANKKFSRSGRFPEKNGNPHGGWDFSAARWKFIYLPYISYHRSKFDFYFGWRNRGNFGIKVNINPKQNPKEPNATPPDGDRVDGSQANNEDAQRTPLLRPGYGERVSDTPRLSYW